MTWTTVHEAQTGGGALYSAPRLQYNAHLNVGISVVAAQSGSVEYCGLTMRSCKYFVYVRDHSSHSVNWRMCAIFGTKFAV
jgi:hypothetical protein